MAFFIGNPANNLIKELNCGLSFPKENPENLSEGVIQLYKTPLTERRAMGKRGQQYVKENHDIKVLADRLKECIEDA